MIALSVFVLAIVLLNFATVYFFGLPLSPVAITGEAIKTGYVRVSVESFTREITIHFPGNNTYDKDDFTCVAGEPPRCNDGRYLLNLNVSANFFVESTSNWTYSLYDLKHGEPVYTGLEFTPNASVDFGRWGNRLIVSVEEEDGDLISETLILTIDVDNSAPVIEGLDSEIFVCESEEIEWLEASYFNVTDFDEEDFSNPDYRDIKPKNPDLFSVEYVDDINYTLTSLQIASVPLGKGSVRSYIRNVTINDGDKSDLVTINITVIEVNNPPVIYVGGDPDANGIGAQTIYEKGVGSVFTHQMNVSDVEDGWTVDGNLSFNMTSTHPDIVFDNTTGTVSYISYDGEGRNNPTYNITVCATDNALGYVPDNFSICSARNHTTDNQTVCDDFTLTITDDNRAPVIVANSPESPLTVKGTTTTIFNASVSDADMTSGYPDLDWYVNGVAIAGESNENVSSDTYSWSAGCGVSGIYNITAVTNDSLLTDSVSWNVTVISVDCLVDTRGGSGGGSGGGGGALGGLCNEQWSCSIWGLCQNAERSFDAEVLSFEDFSSTKDLCAQNQFDDRFCGFQITRCVDLQQCNNSELRIPSPPESQICYFTENPNCLDGITNCHDGDCELLVDCGGPCGPCPTCSDGIQNQGEGNVDCGGPCPYVCEAERAFGAISAVLILLLLALIVVGLFILWKLVNILRYRFFLKRKKR